MSDFIKHFIQSTEDSHTRLTINEQENLLGKLPDYYRKCYVLDEDLKSRITNLNRTAEEIIKNYIPDRGKTMSGEFGEILAYQLIIDMYSQNIELFGPKKWLWKTDSNEPMKKTDVILFGYKNQQSASGEDVVVAAEIKTKATLGAFNPIEDAVNGSKDDYVIRMAKTFTWLEEFYIKKNDKDSLLSIDRFINAINPKYGPYKKYFKAIAVIDSDMLQEELDKNIDASIRLYKKDWKDIKSTCESIGAVYDETERKLSFANVVRDKIIQTECTHKEKILALYDLYNFNIGDLSDLTVVSIDKLKETYETLYDKILTSFGEVVES